MTGQVASDEPRPISISRQPLLPRRVTIMPLIQDLNPAIAVLRVAAMDVEADDFRAPQAAGKAEQQHRAVAQAAQRAAVEGLEHGDDVFRQHGLFLPGRGGMGVADAGEHGRDMPIRAVERRPTLRVIPGQGGEPALDRRDSFGWRSAVAAPEAQAVM